jgi:hypothetical protein
MKEDTMEIEDASATVEAMRSIEPLTEAQAAARLGLKVATLRAWRPQGGQLTAIFSGWNGLAEAEALLEPRCMRSGSDRARVGEETERRIESGTGGFSASGN